jgi:hypothetical protein
MSIVTIDLSILTYVSTDVTSAVSLMFNDLWELQDEYDETVFGDEYDTCIF